MSELSVKNLIIYLRFFVYGFVLYGFSFSYAGSYDDFFQAIKQDDAKTMQSLLQRGFDPNSVNPKGEYALVVALRVPAHHQPVGDAVIVGRAIKVGIADRKSVV